MEAPGGVVTPVNEQASHASPLVGVPLMVGLLAFAADRKSDVPAEPDVTHVAEQVNVQVVAPGSYAGTADPDPPILRC